MTQQPTTTANDLAAILTALVAAAGLLLSIYNFIVDRRDKAPRLIAKISNGFITSGLELSDLMLLLETANTGEKAVKISAVELKWKNQKMMFLKGIEGTVQVPFQLQPGDNATFWMPIKEVTLALKKQGCTDREFVRACFRTAIGSEFVSRKFPIHIE